MRSARLLLVALVAALGLAATAPSIARAADPCWQRVILDWSKDGVVSKHYSPHCLRLAIKKAPEDLRDYSSIIDDINAALLAALGGNGTTNGPNNGGGNGTTNGTPGNGGQGGPEAPSNQPARITQKALKAVPNAGTKESAPGHSRQFPLPLILLACVLAVAALAAGAPPLIKRLRTRPPRLRPAAGSVRPPA